MKEQIGKLDAIKIGESGQIKEFREETKYGEIGEYTHRHISHLCALYPGTTINNNTPEWMKAAIITLNKRGDKSTGWAMAHRQTFGHELRTETKLINYIKIYYSEEVPKIYGEYIRLFKLMLILEQQPE